MCALRSGDMAPPGITAAWPITVSIEGGRHVKSVPARCRVRVINGPRAMSRPRPLLPQERRKRRHSVTSHSCHKRKMPAACVQVRLLLIGVFGVVTEAKALAQEVCDFHTVGMRGVQRFRQVHRTLYRRTGSRSTKLGFLDLSSKRRPGVGSAFNTCNCLGIGGASGLAQPLCRLPMAVFCGDHLCKPYQHIFHTYRTDKRPVDNVCCGSNCDL